MSHEDLRTRHVLLAVNDSGMSTTLYDKEVPRASAGPSPFIELFCSYSAPSDEEAVGIRRFMEECERKADSIAEEIREMQDALSRKIAQRGAYLKAIEEHNSLFSVDRRIPFDIKQRVFQLCVDAYDASPDRTSNLHPALFVSHVCQNWRRVALDSPQLWSTLKIDVPVRHLPDDLAMMQRKMKAWLEIVNLWTMRSRQMPITLYLENDYSDQGDGDLTLNASYRQLVDIIRRSSLRLKEISMTLFVSTAARPLLELLRLTPAQLPVLEKLAVRVFSMPQSSEGSFAQEVYRTQLESSLFCVPSLRSLTLYGGWVGLSFIDRMSALTSLELGGFDPQTGFDMDGPYFLKLLKALPSLIQVTLATNSAGSLEPLPNPIVMPVLSSMDLHWSPIGTGFATSLLTPSLRDLSLSHYQDAPIEDVNGGTVECIRHFGKTLTRLKFSRASVGEDALITILDSLPKLEQLELISSVITWVRSPPRSDPGLDCIVLVELNGGSTGSLRCPELQVLRMKFSEIYSDDDLVKEAISHFLQVRLSAMGSNGRPCLREVDIQTRQGGSGDLMDVGEELRIRELESGGITVCVRTGNGVLRPS